MYTLHPDKLLALNTTVGKVPKPVPAPAPARTPRRTYDLRPNLVETLAAKLYASTPQHTGGTKGYIGGR